MHSFLYKLRFLIAGASEYAGGGSWKHYINRIYKRGVGISGGGSRRNVLESKILSVKHLKMK